jgi:uncharacterized protein YbjT (DUF2867 family)
LHVLVIGATGLIGSATAARLLAEGNDVTGVARRGQMSIAPRMRFTELDIQNVCIPEKWLPHLKGIDAVVNCAGVLQDTTRDSTALVHVAGPAALFTACEKAGVGRVIHVSAIGVDRNAPTAFSRSKAQGEAALISSSLDWVILRPSVVLGRVAYGGSALFRGLASLPLTPRLPAAGKLQVVQLDDLVSTIVYFLSPGAPSRIQLEIAGPERLSLEDVITSYRCWLGWKPSGRVSVPSWALSAASWLGDLLGWFGWRSPIRSTVHAEIMRGAIGDPERWTATTGLQPQSLGAALACEPAGVQEAWFSRLYLLKPIVFATLSLFWISTGLVSIGPGWNNGIALLHEGGITGIGAPLTVIAGTITNLLIGVGIAFRRTARSGLYAALLLSLAYMVIGTILVPRLWIDPLGPLVKIWPVLALNLMALAIFEDRSG